MEGKLSTEDDNSSPSPTRRRVLKASAALTATGVVTTTGFTGNAAAAGRTDVSCGTGVQCEGTIIWDQGTVGNGCGAGTVNDSVTLDTVVVSCPNGGWIDLHDKKTDTGPSGSYGAGYPVGMSTIFQDDGTYTDVCIELFQNSEDVPNRTECTIEWDRGGEWPNAQNSLACRSMSAMLHVDDPSDGTITHYCTHEDGVKGAEDPAYLCDRDNDGTREPVQTVNEICGDGKG